MNYSECIEYLESLGKFGIRLGMERIEALLKELGNPEKKYKTIHITGTNGKGSVASFLTDILLAAGLKTGKYTSPHLVKYNERITMNGTDISDEDFATAVSAAKVAADSVLQKKLCDQPTQFEVITAAAFLYYYLAGAEYVVVEVGMGGLWDSTNVITPVVSVITNVAMDHMQRLGPTLDHIAMNKAGIIKNNVPVVTAAEGHDALGPIVTMAMFKNAPVYLYGKAFYGTEIESSMAGQKFTLHAGDIYQSDYEIKLAGAHQIKNCCMAIVAAKLASKQDDRINELALHIGVAHTTWPGRLERIGEKPEIILDGAHNPNGAESLRNALDKYYPGKAINFVFGMMADKDMQGVIRTLIRPADKVFAVRADQGKRAAEAADLARLVGPQAVPVGDIAEAYGMAVAEAGAGGVVCVCGSLYLVGEFKKLVEAGREQLH